MFCIHCGANIEGSVAACGSCGRGVQSVGATQADIARAVKEASSDALGAIRIVAADPVGGLSTSFAALGDRRSAAAGVAFGIAFALLTAFAMCVAASKLQQTLTLKFALGAFIVALVPFAAIAATSAAARSLLRTTGTLGGDLFTAGAALQPIGLYFVLAAILGIGNFEVIAILGVFAWTYFICMLFAGATRLVQLPERFAPTVVSVMLLLSVWLTKVMAASLLESAYPFRGMFG